MKNKALFVLCLALIILGACSRPAPVRQSPAKAAADATLRLAQSLEQKHRFLDSGQSYQASLRQYRSFGDLRGEAYSLSGLARLSFIAADSLSFGIYRQNLAELIHFADPEAVYIAILLDLYILQEQSDYVRILERARDSYDYPLGIRIQLLTHALQAESRVKPDFSGKTFNDLLRLSNRYRRSLKRDFSADPSVLSAALYAMAYHNFLLKNHSQALRFISEAVDLDERYENFSALGYDMWLRANILESLGETDLARSNFIRAGAIFAHFENTEMLAKTEAATMRLRGD